MRPRRHILIITAFLPVLALTIGCSTPPVTPGFYGQYKVASKQLWEFPVKKTFPDGILHFPSSDGRTIDPAAVPCPVIVFVPGYLEPPMFYASYGEQAASWGYAVLIAHFIWMFDDQAEQDTLKLIQWLRRQNEDGGVLDGMLDMERVGVAAHSIGGKYALAATLKDPDIRAAVVIEPVDLFASYLPPSPLFRSFTPELMPQVAVPTCILGADRPGPFNPRSENYHQFYLHATCLAEEIVVYDADHGSFVDDFCGLFQDLNDLFLGGGPTQDNRAKNIAARTMVSWFNVFLRGQDEFWTYLTGENAQQEIAAKHITITTNFETPSLPTPALTPACGARLLPHRRCMPQLNR